MKTRNIRMIYTILSWAIGAMIALTFQGNVLALENWEKKLGDQGWVKVESNLMKFANTTWYGQKGKSGNRENWVYYIDPSGKKVFFTFNKIGGFHTGTREERKDGKICTQYKDLGGGKKRCNRTLWKKGEIYMAVSEIGYELHRWRIKKGNLEKSYWEKKGSS